MAEILTTFFGMVLIVLIWVMLYDTNRFVVKSCSVSDKRIRKKCRAVVLADLHNKRFGKDNEQLLAAVREQAPDVILIAGDMITAKPGKSLEPALKLIGALAEEYPIYYGNGNHEYRLKSYPETYGDMAERYGQALRELGVEPLANSHAVLAEFGLAVYGAEIDREYYRRFRIRKMQEDYLDGILGRPGREMYTVLLAHNPDYFPRYAAWGADLVLAGHTHGGIVRIPILGKGVISPGLRPFPKYDGGIFREYGSTMILSRGLGTHSLYMRLFNPGELWVVDFVPEGE